MFEPIRNHKILMKKLLPLILVFSTLFAQSQDLLYYLPGDVSFDPAIPAPESLLGHQVGEYHVSHDKLVTYMERMAAATPRMVVETIGYTYERRPYQAVIITSPSNHDNLEQIRQQHLLLADPSRSASVDVSAMPAVVLMGYSIHGNEASGANASLLAAYYLAAAQGEEIETLLQNTVILMIPSFNPDGLQRFSGWVNANRSKNIVSDRWDMEHNESWPRGRTNHYWFDLNRDWLPAQHPESRARVAFYHSWKPNILTDHHEMGTNRTFFFQPGEPTRIHPLTPKGNIDLTYKIAQYHAKYLDQIGSLYYSEEGYDDFYYGKGSTMPDVNGAVGILFEQGSARGHAQDSENGVVTFPFAIRNQFTTTLSTLAAAQDLRLELLNHLRDFYQSSTNFAASSSVKAYVFGEDKYPLKNHHLAEILKLHGIDIYRPSRNINSAGNTFTTTGSYIVPVNQAQARFITAMFEKRTTFTDSLFYDVSAWSLPLAFDLNYAELGSRAYNANMLGAKVDNLQFPGGTIEGGRSEYAYVFESFGYYTPRAVNELLSSGLRVKVSSASFTTNGRNFPAGSLVVSVQNQVLPPDQVHALIERIAKRDGLMIYSVSSGLTPGGIDLGSPRLEPLRKPNILMITGGSTSSYESGEVWHLLDYRYNMKVTRISERNFNRANLNKYNTLVLVNGNYNGISKNAKDKLKTWIQQGGVVVATKGAGKWLADNGLSNARYKKIVKDSTLQVVYGNYQRDQGAQEIGGSIFSATLDVTHPIGYGFTSRNITIFRNSELFMEKGRNPYGNPLVYTGNPLVSGYISSKNTEFLRGTAAITVYASGGGRIITFSDNPNFRAFWYGTNKLFTNAILFGSTITSGTAR